MSTGLRARPSAETFPLDDLVERAREGRIRVPRFQRGLRWTRRDVVQLFDSVLKGYPVGSLLFWERDAPAETVTLGPISIEAPAGVAFYVVDGQQRITALAAALSGINGHDAQFQEFQVGYDLATGEFVGSSAHAAETYIPASVLFDLSALLAWFRDRPALADSFDDAAAVAKTLRDLRIPAYVVHEDDEEVLRTIFDRMNNSGKKLTRGEVFAALHRPSDRSGEVTLRSVAESLEARTGFGLLDDGITMQVILARRGPDVMREIRNEFKPDARGRDSFAAAESEADAYRLGADAAVLAARFAQRVAQVPHLALLPYQYLLVTLTRFFAHHPAPSPRNVRLLRRFFWRAVVNGPTLGRGNTTGVGRMLNRLVVPDDQPASVAALISAVSHRPPYPDVNPFRTNSAASKMLLCAVWEHGPRSIVTGVPVEVEDLRAALAEGGSQTAVDLVFSLVPERSAAGRGKEAGNRLLLVTSEDRESEVLAGLAAADEHVLASHLLDPVDVQTLQSADALQVIGRRNDRLNGLQRSFLDRMCEWDQEDTPDLTALAAGDATDAPH